MKSLTSEELLKPRYKVIADYPKSLYRVDQIIEDVYLGQTKCDGWIYEDCCKYPHLFQKLEWWEEREEYELPKKIKYRYRDSNVFIYLHVNEWKMCSSRAYPTRVVLSDNKTLYLTSKIISLPVD